MILVLALLWFFEDPEALSSKALELAQQQRTDEAEKLWKQALSQQPNLFSAAFNLGYLHYSRKDYAAAEPFLLKAADLSPENFNVRYVAGACLSQLGRIDEALEHWRAALALKPDHVKLMQIMAVEYGKGRYFRDAADVAQRALSIQQADPAIYLLAIKAWQDAAEHGAALKIAEQLIQRFPELPRANFEYGFLLHLTGRTDEGVPFLKKAMSADPPWEEPFFFYGEILIHQNRASESLAFLRRAIELRPGYMAARVTLARALMGLGKNDEAKDELQKAVQQDPRHPQPRLLLSQLYFRLGDENAAAREKAASLKLRRENPQAMEPQQGRSFQTGQR
jgi:protein O-GlcNAc transferase